MFSPKMLVKQRNEVYSFEHPRLWQILNITKKCLTKSLCPETIIQRMLRLHSVCTSFKIKNDKLLLCVLCEIL